MKTFIVPVVSIFLAFCFWNSGVRAEKSLVFGLYPTEQPSAMISEFRPALDLVEESMSKCLGERVEITVQVVRDYFAGLDLVLSGNADFMRLGPVSYVKGKAENPGIELIAMESNHGSVRFHGVIAVHPDSDITDITQLKGRTFAFVSRRSTLGRYFPQLYLSRAGITARDLKRYEYLGRHDEVGKAVGAGLFDAGAFSERMFNKLAAEGFPLRMLVKYENVTRAWVARAGLDPRLKEALRKALHGLDDPRIFEALGFEGFLPGDDSYYHLTREVIAENGRFFAHTR